MKTLITARFDRNYTDLLETITTDYEFAGYGVTGEKMPVPQMKEKIKGVELLISEFEDINREVIEAADRLKIIVCCRNEAFASVDIEAATEKGIPVLRAGGKERHRGGGAHHRPAHVRVQKYQPYGPSPEVYRPAHQCPVQRQ